MLECVFTEKKNPTLNCDVDTGHIIFKVKLTNFVGNKDFQYFKYPI